MIRGGQATIQNAELLLMEVTFIELYKGQLLFDQIYESVRRLGFQCVGTTYPLCDRNSGRALQTDALFARHK